MRGLGSWKLGPGTDTAGVGAESSSAWDGEPGCHAAHELISFEAEIMRETLVRGLLCDLLKLHVSNLLQIRVGGAQT